MIVEKNDDMKRLIGFLMVAVLFVGCGKGEMGVDMTREVVMEVSGEWVELELRGVGERSGNRIEGDVWESMGVGGELDGYAMVVIGEQVEYVPLNGELQRVGFEMGSECVISVFGSVTELVCRNSGLVGIVVRGNDILHRLDVSENEGMSTEAYDRLYCSLPDRVGLRSGELLALSAWGEDDEHVNDVVESNGNNARMRNWKVLEGWTEVETRGVKRCE